MNDTPNPNNPSNPGNQGNPPSPHTSDTPHIIDVSVQDSEWESFDAIEALVQDVAQKALSMALLPEAAQGKPLEASIVLANDDLVQILNHEYRDKNKPTNVLTFAALDDEEHEELMPGEALHLGDVILAYQTIEREAQEQNKLMSDHLKHLIVHGVLHLLQYDHETEDEANDMETLEIRVLESLGIQNPYTEMLT